MAAIIGRMKKGALLEYIRIYEEEVSLWNMKSPFYFNKQMKQRAQERLLAKLREVHEPARKSDVVNTLARFRKIFLTMFRASKSDKSVERALKRNPENWYLKHLNFLSLAYGDEEDFEKTSNSETDSKDSTDSSSEEEGTSDYSDNSQKARPRTRIVSELPTHVKEECADYEVPVKVERTEEDELTYTEYRQFVKREVLSESEESFDLLGEMQTE